MSTLKAIINGNIINKEEAVLHINDLSIERGYGIFDYFKTVNGIPVFWEESLDRFFHSAQAMRLTVDYDRDALKESILQLMQLNNIPDAGIKLLLTGGYSADGYSMGKPNLIITQQVQKRNETAEQNGLRLITHEHQRQLPTVKTIDYLMGILTQPLVKEKNADDVLYHQNGCISECPRSNIFIVTKEDRIITPEKNVLHGVTRKQILAIAQTEFETITSDISLDDLYQAKEIFISSTSKNITPIVAVNDKTFAIGNITRHLQAQLNHKIYG
jgi:D-alanine transaminase/branched-chain amino acid aminotransferase